jgi:hypothetical protein
MYKVSTELIKRLDANLKTDNVDSEVVMAAEMGIG